LVANKNQWNQIVIAYYLIVLIDPALVFFTKVSFDWSMVSSGQC